MPSLTNPELEDYVESAPDSSPPKAVVVPPVQVEPLTETPAHDPRQPATELNDFLEEAEKLERKKSEEPAKSELPKDEGEKEKSQNTPQDEEKKKPEGEGHKKGDASPEAEKKDAKKAPETEEVAPELLKVLPHDKEITAKRIRHFLKELKSKDEILQEKERVISELSTKAQAPVGQEELKKRDEELAQTKDELLKYRRKYQLDTDPEIKRKFDEPVTQAEDAIAKVLGSDKYALGEGTLKVIKESGGLAEFSRSGKLFPVVEVDPNDRTQTIRVQKTAGELVRSWLNGMDIADSEYVKAQLARQFTAKDDKKRFLDEESARATEYFKTQEQFQQKARSEQETVMAQTLKEFSSWADNQIKEKDWLQEKKIPPTASPAEKKSTEEHNQFVKTLQEMIKNPLTDSKEKILARLVDGVEAHYLRKEKGVREAELKTVKAELEKLKSGMRTTPKSGSLLTPQPRKEKNGKLDTNFEDSFERAVQAKLDGVE